MSLNKLPSSCNEWHVLYYGMKDEDILGRESRLGNKLFLHLSIPQTSGPEIFFFNGTTRRRRGGGGREREYP